MTKPFNSFVRLRQFTAICGLAILAVVAPGQVVFTVHGVVDETETDIYTEGQEVSFSFVLRNSAGAVPAGAIVDSETFFWEDDNLSNPELWQSVSGTGLTGTWMRPAEFEDSPLSILRVEPFGGPDLLMIHAGTDTDAEDGLDTGLTAGGLGLKEIRLAAAFAGLDFASLGATLPEPTQYFSAYAGTYAADSSFFAEMLLADASDEFEINFMITGLTIAYTPTSAIPEPSTYAVLTGALVLGCGVWRRRRGAPAAVQAPR